MRNHDGKFALKVHRKKTCSNIYLHWKSFAPDSWKLGTLKGMFRRAYLVCTNSTDLNDEIRLLKQIFKDVNGYPQRVIDKCHREIKNKMTTTPPGAEEQNISNSVSSTQNTRDTAEETPPQEVSQPMLVLPFAGKQGEQVMKKLNRGMPENLKLKVVYTGRKLSSLFSLKDPINKNHQSNLVYYYKDPNSGVDYAGETKCRLEKRMKEHKGTDKESAIVKHCKTTDSLPPSSDDFTVLGTNYPNRLKRKIAESLYIKHLKPALNKQKDSFTLNLFI